MNRPYRNLTNEEIQILFELRASKIKLDPKGLWDDIRKVACWSMISPMKALYEMMLEIQARYPQRECEGNMDLLPDYDYSDPLKLRVKND